MCIQYNSMINQKHYIFEFPTKPHESCKLYDTKTNETLYVSKESVNEELQNANIVHINYVSYETIRNMILQDQIEWFVINPLHEYSVDNPENKLIAFISKDVMIYLAKVQHNPRTDQISLPI